MTRVVFHVGGGKCGSSALQAWLTQQAWQADSASFSYVVMSREGKVEEPLHPSSRWSGYDASAVTLWDVARWPEVHQKEACRQLESRGGVVVVSNEAFSSDVRRVLQDEQSWLGLQRFFQHFESPPEFVLFTRPQIGWAHSAYLQWGIWQGLEPADYVQSVVLRRRAADWSQVAAAFGCLTQAVVHTRFVQDTVSDFCLTILGSAPPNLGRGVNSALSLDLLLLELRHRQLRPAPNRPKTEFIVERLMRNSKVHRSVPNLIGHDLALEIFREHEEANEQLASTMPDGQGEAFLSRCRQELAESVGRETLDVAALLRQDISPQYLEELATRTLLALRPDRFAAP